MGEKLQCYAVSTWQNMRNADFNSGLQAAIDHIRHYQNTAALEEEKSVLAAVAENIENMKVEVDTTRLPD